MQRGFTKLFNTILTSTIWQEDDSTRIVWITLLALCDATGEVSGSVPGLAHVARVSPEACSKALKKLKSPDPDSRTKTDEGRRIKEIDGGWLILNYQRYRRLLSAEERREYKRIKQQEYRLREKEGEYKVSTLSTGGQNGHIAEAEADGEAESCG